MSVKIRTAASPDAQECGRIIHEAFTGLAEHHRFPSDFPTAEVGVQLATLFINHPSIFSVVAERDDQIVGSNFLDERDPIRGVGFITVDPRFQKEGIGRQLMEAVIERGRSAVSVRLLQDSFNTLSISLYAKLGFDVKEPILLMAGKPRSKPPAGIEVRRLESDDLSACAALCSKVHGFERTNELRDALQAFSPFAVLREGRVTAYASSMTFWLANHGVADTEENMKALILGAGATSSEPVSFLLPTRQAGLFRWCLSEGLRSIKPMTYMVMGEYREPRGSYFPSVLY